MAGGAQLPRRSRLPFQTPTKDVESQQTFKDMVVSRRSGARVARGVEEISKACVHKEFYWEKRGDHGPAKYDVSFENVEQSLQAWVGLDFVLKAGAENGTNLTHHAKHVQLSPSIETSLEYVNLKKRIFEVKLQYLDSLAAIVPTLPPHDSAASADCSHRFQMEESLVF